MTRQNNYGITSPSEVKEVWRDWLGVVTASVTLSGSQARDARTARAALLAKTGFNPLYVRATRVRVTGHGTAHYQLVTKH